MKKTIFPLKANYFKVSLFQFQKFCVKLFRKLARNEIRYLDFLIFPEKFFKNYTKKYFRIRRLKISKKKYRKLTTNYHEIWHFFRFSYIYKKKIEDIYFFKKE